MIANGTSPKPVLISASDEHGNIEIRSFMKVQLDDPSNITAASLFEAMRENPAQAIRVSYYRNIVPVVDRNFRVVSKMGDYFLGLDKFQSASWVAWSVIAYAVILLAIVRLMHAKAGVISKKVAEHPSKRSILFSRKFLK